MCVLFLFGGSGVIVCGLCVNCVCGCLCRGVVPPCVSVVVFLLCCGYIRGKLNGCASVCVVLLVRPRRVCVWCNFDGCDSVLSTFCRPLSDESCIVPIC